MGARVGSSHTFSGGTSSPRALYTRQDQVCAIFYGPTEGLGFSGFRVGDTLPKWAVYMYTNQKKASWGPRAIYSETTDLQPGHPDRMILEGCCRSSTSRRSINPPLWKSGSPTSPFWGNGFLHSTIRTWCVRLTFLFHEYRTYERPQRRQHSALTLQAWAGFMNQQSTYSK